MRLLAGAAIVLHLGAADVAGAQMLPDGPGGSLLAPLSPTMLALADDPIGALLDHQSSGPGGQPARWRSSQFRLTPARRGGAVTSVRVTMGDSLRVTGALPLSQERPLATDSKAYEVALVRDWPGAVRFGAGAFNVDLSPHAGLGMGAAGGSAEAGATVRLGRRLDDAFVRRMKAIGVRDGTSFGDLGRWYIFAAASGRAVGLNLLHNSDGWNREGFSTDPAAATIADAQVGVGWRSGAVQTSFGYIRREVKTDHKVWGQETHADSLVALSFSIRPGR